MYIAWILLNGWPLEFAEDIEFLGVIIDYKLSWKKHIKTVTNKVRCGIVQLYMSRVISCGLRTTEYNAIVNSRLPYDILAVLIAMTHCMKYSLLKNEHFAISLELYVPQRKFEVIQNLYLENSTYWPFRVFMATWPLDTSCQAYNWQKTPILIWFTSIG